MADRDEKMSLPGLLNDIMFKIVFGSPQSEAVLKCLLNALLDLKGPDRVVDLEILNPSLYYTTRLFSDQLKSGHDYHLLERSLSISILDFVLFPESQELHSNFVL